MLFEREYFRQQPGGRVASYWRRHSVVFHLIVINAVAFLLCRIAPAQDPLALYPTDRLTALCALIPSQGYAWQLWRYVTYQFIHHDIMHIIFNMYALWLFGRMIESRLGAARFLTLYLFSGVLGGFFYTWANFGQLIPCIGASGAVFGVMVAAAMAFPYAEFFLLFPPMRIKLWVMVLIYCGLELWSEVGGRFDGVAHLAHLGGALGGFLFMRRLGIRPFAFRRSNGGERSRNDPPPRRRPPSPAPADDTPFVFDQEEINRILDKMARQGYEQLTDQERTTLQRASEELKRRRNQAH